ncbi:MAG: phospho-N-acetylmuramoyl-pentapeptide-transferase [Planctomycetota bacterium]
MFYWLGEQFADGTLLNELLTSRIILSSLGVTLGGVCCWWLLPLLSRLLPRDRGNGLGHTSEKARGKPTGGGVIFVTIYVAVSCLVLPWKFPQIGVLVLVLLAMVSGFLDDRSPRPWGEYRKAVLDLAIALGTALILFGGRDTTVWLPLVRQEFVVPGGVYVAIATALLWMSINATNCTDGVDGLSGSLLVLAFFYLGVMLYAVIGHKDIAPYFHVPHDGSGANWGIGAFTLLGTLAGYLWYNANPSEVLMGDAGSRPLGLLLGVLVLVTGNPFLILVVAGVVLLNGGTGLVKVALLRFFKIGIFRNVRFPLHDHCRARLGWSNAQVLMRFMLLQAVLTPLLIVILLRLR